MMVVSCALFASVLSIWFSPSDSLFSLSLFCFPFAFSYLLLFVLLSCSFFFFVHLHFLVFCAQSAFFSFFVLSLFSYIYRKLNITATICVPVSARVFKLMCFPRLLVCRVRGLFFYIFVLSIKHSPLSITVRSVCCAHICVICAQTDKLVLIYRPPVVDDDFADPVKRLAPCGIFQSRCTFPFVSRSNEGKKGRQRQQKK